MPEYSEQRIMKQTREQWLGDIPASWGALRLKRIFSIKKDIAGEEGHTVLSVTQKGIRPKSMSEKGQFAQDYSKYQLVKNGDFVMNHMDLLTGWVDISEYDGVTSPDYRVFINTKPDQYDSSYYRYIFQLCYSARIFYGLGQGVAGFGRWRLPSDMFLNFVLPVPSIKEQQAIASYLDDQVTQIDSTIAEAQASIEEYKQWKNATVFEGVTKGLDDQASLRETGIDIVGKIPAHWGIRRLKFLCDISTGNQDTQDAEPEGEYPFYVRSPIVERSNHYTYDGEGILMAGDGAGAGRVFHHAFGKYAIHQRVYCLHNFRDIETRYLYHYMSNLFSVEMDKGSAKSTVPSVRLPMLLNFRICLPPKEEQIAIADYLDTKAREMDSVITEKIGLIDDLETYKRSLIYEAVTGKRKVV